jgi:hypothetical protein
MGESALATLLSTGPGVHSFSRSWRSAPGSETPSERTVAGHPGSFALLCADQPTRCEPAWTLASARARLALETTASRGRGSYSARRHHRSLQFESDDTQARMLAATCLREQMFIKCFARQRCSAERSPSRSGVSVGQTWSLDDVDISWTAGGRRVPMEDETGAGHSALPRTRASWRLSLGDW